MSYKFTQLILILISKKFFSCFICDMKVNFLNFNTITFPRIPQSTHINSNAEIYKSGFELPSFYYAPVFGNLQTPDGENNDFDKEIESLKDVHCPLCGVKMVSKEQKKDVLEEASHINDSKEFVELLKNHKERFYPRFKHLYDFITSEYEKNPDLSPLELIENTKNHGNQLIKAQLESCFQYLNNVQKSKALNYDDNRLIELCKHKIKALEHNQTDEFSFKEFKSILHDTIAQMSIYGKWEIYDNVKLPVWDLHFEKLSFCIDKSKLDEGCTPAYLLMKNILKFSTSNINYIFGDTSSKENKFYNKLLLCRQCSYEKGSVRRFLNSDSPESDINYKKYMSDIANHIVNDDFKIEPRYPLNLAGFVEKASNGRHKIAKGADIFIQLRAKLFDNDKDIDFDLVNFDNVPCAACGKDCISHKQKLDIFERIEKASSMQELETIIDDNIDVIRPKYMPLIEVFKRDLHFYPQISDEEMMKDLFENSSINIETQLRRNVKRLEKLLRSNEYSAADKHRIRQCIEGIKNDFLTQDKNHLFEYADYRQLINATLLNLDSKNRYKYNNILKNNIKDVFLPQTMLNVSDELKQRYHSATKVAIQNIFKMSVATRDHVLSRNHDGSDDKSNLVVLCKDCNQNKKAYSLKYEMYNHHEYKKNFVKYLNFVKDKISKGELDESYIAYIDDISKQYARLTKNLVKAPDNFLSDFMV